MDKDELALFIDRLPGVFGPVIGDVSVAAHPPVEGRWLDRKGGHLKSRHGIYVVADLAGKVLYIGKAESSDLAARVWAHVNKPSKDRDLVPNRDGVVIYPELSFEGEEKDLAGLRRGEFMIYAFEIDPKHFASLFEVAAQTYCLQRDGSLPRLNNRIG